MSQAPVRVLLVDDKSADVRGIQELLAPPTASGAPGEDSATFEVVAVDRLSIALSRLRQERYDAVLLDLSLPDNAGLEGIKAVQAGRTDLAVVVLSPVRDETIAVRAVQQGAQDFLIKGELDGPLVARSLLFAIERQKRAAALSAGSMQDALTGLFSRAAFLVLADARWHLARRIEKGFSLIIVDLDDYPRLVEAHGESTGEKALVLAASVLKKTFRTVDVLARLGQETFGVLALDSSPASDERRRVRLMDNFRKELAASGLPPIAFSSGVAHLDPDVEQSVEELLIFAEAKVADEKSQKSAA